MIQQDLVIILVTEPRILCSEVNRENNSTTTQIRVYYPPLKWHGCLQSAQHAVHSQQQHP